MRGGCLCGRIRYEVSAAPLGQAVCHCTHCQRQAGSAFSVLVVVPAAALKIEGVPAVYEDKGDSGARVERHFCGHCGSPIYSGLPASPGAVFLKAGSLDDTSGLDPKLHVWCDSARAWTAFPEDAIRIAKSPPSG